MTFYGINPMGVFKGNPVIFQFHGSLGFFKDLLLGDGVFFDEEPLGSGAMEVKGDEHANKME